MARPHKSSVDYFPHYVSHKKTVYIIENLYGNDGYAFWFKVLELLGSEEGHFYDYSTTAAWEFLLAKTRVSGVIADKILLTLSELQAIDPELYKTKIIWSQNFVDNLSHVYQRRKIEQPLKPVKESYCIQKPLLSGVNVYNNSKNEPFKGVSADINPHSKVNESKVNESKVEERIVKENITVQLDAEPTPENFYSEEPNTGSNIAKSGRTPKASNNAKQPKKAKLTDEEWLERLKSNPAYTGIDIAAVHGKMLAWCELKGKEPTRARLLNWLNREERPMTGKPQATYSKNSAAAMRMIEALREEKQHAAREG